MISSLTGTVGAQGTGWVQLIVNGVGFRVDIPTSATMPAMEELTLHTALVVREDSLTLFGFANPGDRDAFDVLMGVTGIGPRLALAAIDTLGVETLREAIAGEQLKTLQRIPGVGKKTAQRMVLEIGEKLGPPTPPASADVNLDTHPSADHHFVQAALEQLGWPKATAERAIADVDGGPHTSEELLRAALLNLGGAR